MDRNKKIAAALGIALLLPAAAAAQSDFGLWLSAGAEKKINKRWSVEAEAEMRTRNDAQTVDRYDVGLTGEYKICKWLKASAGYELRVVNNREKLTYNASGSYNNWRPSYWGVRHAVHAGLTASVKWDRLTVSLRERWQYVYRPEVTTDRYDFDNEWWESTTVRSKSKNTLRSRLRIAYDIPGSNIGPFADVELFNNWSLQKVRYTAGADWKITKKHEVGVFYRYQDNNNDDSEGSTMHIVGVAYKFKF